MIKITSRLPLIATLLMALSLIVYFGIRAVKIGFTIDESSSFLNLMNASITDLFYNKQFWITANNHPVNSLFMQLGHKLFGAEEWALRWCGMTGGLIFLLYTMRLVCLWLPMSSWRFFAACGVFLLNPYMVEFFSLGRGYGLCLGFEMAGLFYFFRWIKKNESDVDLFKTSMSFSLGILSNFTLMDIVPPFIIIVLIIIYSKSSTQITIFDYFKRLLWMFIPLLLTLILIYKPLSWIRAGGEFHYGPISFWETWRVLIQRFVYNPKPDSLWTQVPVLFTGTLLFVMMAYFILKRYKNYGFSWNISLFAGALLTLFTMWVTVAQYLILDTHYLTDRTALLFYPLLSLVVVLTLISFEDRAKFSGRAWAFISFFLMFNFLIKANFKNFDEWRWEEFTRDAVYYANEKWNSGQKIKYEVGWQFNPTTRFYQKTRALNNIEPIEFNDNHDDALYLKSKSPDLIYVLNKLQTQMEDQYEVIKKFRDGVLMQKKSM